MTKGKKTFQIKVETKAVGKREKKGGKSLGFRGKNESHVS